MSIKCWLQSLYNLLFVGPPFPAPGTTYEDDVLGTLEADMDFGWRGRYTFEGDEIEVLLVNDGLLPDMVVLEAAKQWLLAGPASKGILLQHIAEELQRYKYWRHLNAESFRITSVSLLREKDPGDIFIQLEYPGDEEKIWRVEYTGGQPVPKGLGYDS